MISDSELDEEIRRVLDQGSAAPTEADELAMLRADLAKQGANMTPSMGEEMPKGTKVVFADETQTPVTPQSAAARQPIIPKVVDLTKQPMDDFEMAYAKRADMEARAREAFERGSRELVAGLTRTPVASTFEQQKDAVARLLAKRKDKDAALERTNAQRLNAAKFDYDQRSEAEKKAMEAQRRKEDLEERAKDNERADRGIEATNRLAQSNFGLRKDDADAKKQEREDKMAAGTVPFVGGTLTMKPGLDGSERSKARDYASSWNAAITNVDGVRDALGSYLQKPSIENKGAVESQLVGALTALNVAYKQGAMADTEARRLSAAMGVDLTNPAGIAAAVSSLFTGDPGEAGRILKVKIDTLRNASRKAAVEAMRPYGDFSDGDGAGGGSAPGAPSARPIAVNPQTGEKLEWNGKEWVKHGAP